MAAAGGKGREGREGKEGTEVIAIMEREVISVTEQDVLLFGPIT